MIKKKLERTNENCTWNCETNKGEKNLSTYDNKEDKKE